MSTIQSIQKYYKTLYQHVYDLDYLVDKSLSQCDPTSPLDHLRNLSSVDNFPSVLKSIDHFNQLTSWKQKMQEDRKMFKRQRVEIER